jgi:hypothetical protein
MVARRRDGGLLQRDARTEHHEVGPGKCLRLMTAKLQPYAKQFQRLGFPGVGAHIRHRDARPAACEQFGGRQPAPRGAGDRYAFIRHIESHSINGASALRG